MKGLGKVGLALNCSALLLSIVKRRNGFTFIDNERSHRLQAYKGKAILIAMIVGAFKKECPWVHVPHFKVNANRSERIGQYLPGVCFNVELHMFIFFDFSTKFWQQKKARRYRRAFVYFVL